jgi:hypothetical protein
MGEIWQRWELGKNSNATAEAPKAPRQTPRKNNSFSYFAFLGVFLGGLSVSAVAFGSRRESKELPNLW